MPRDKTDTHNKLLPCIKQEFLEHGYEKASMQNIARRAGITAAGIYRHFPSKEAMFTAMVEPVTSDFLKMCDVSMEETYSRLSDEANREDCSKIPKARKAHKFSAFGKSLSIRTFAGHRHEPPYLLLYLKMKIIHEIGQAAFSYN